MMKEGSMIARERIFSGRVVFRYFCFFDEFLIFHYFFLTLFHRKVRRGKMPLFHRKIRRGKTIAKRGKMNGRAGSKIQRPKMVFQ